MRCYSYLRFSTPEQSLGDSERRQLDMAVAWAKRHGHELDGNLCMADRGLSGYHGHHRTKGVLGKFLASVEAGEVPAGSILVVENIDRLGREGTMRTLRDVIGKLWDRGIVLQTLSPEEDYPPGCDNEPKFIALMLYAQRAHDESKRKSERVSAAREQARKEAHEGQTTTLTNRCPGWLRVAEDGSLEPIPEAVETVRTIFEWKVKGMGSRTIAKRLNTQAFWKPPQLKNRRDGSAKGGTWRASYVKKILANRTVLGEYQPYCRTSGNRVKEGEPIANYFPVVLKPEVFAAVQAKREETKFTTTKNGKTVPATGGQVGKAKNLLRQLAHCGYCGASMAFVDKYDHGSKWLICDNGMRGVRNDGGKPVCSRHAIHYQEVEDLVLANCPELKPSQVLPNPDEQASLCQSLRQRMKGLEAELASIGKKLDNLTDRLLDDLDRDTKESLVIKGKELADRKQQLVKDKVADEAALRTAEQSSKSLARWKRDLKTLRAALSTGDVEIRMRLQAHLRELINRIDVFADGLADGEDLEQGMIDEAYDAWPEDMRDKTKNGRYHGFVKHVVQRRMSKEGRFLTVTFKTGATVNLVPEGSIAPGARVTPRGEWCFFTGSLVKELWAQFEAGRQPARHGRRRKNGRRAQKKQPALDGEKRGNEPD